MSNPVNWFHIESKDVAAQHAFYSKIFAWKTSEGPGGMFFAETGEGGIPGGIAPSMGAHSSVAMYVGVDKLEDSLAAIEAAGGKMMMQPMDLPPGMGRIAMFTDPEGNAVGLWEGAPKPAAAKKAAPRRAAKRKAAPKKAAKKAAPKKAAAKKAAAKKAAPKKAAKKG